MLSALDHVALIVDDLDAAIAQYAALLGVEPNWRGVATGATHAWFQRGNFRLQATGFRLQPEKTCGRFRLWL